MKVTGYQIMDQIEVLREQAQTINGQFTGSLFRFAEATEEKPDPHDLMKAYVECERKVALLQTAQAAYNVRVTVEVYSGRLDLYKILQMGHGA